MHLPRGPRTGTFGTTLPELVLVLALVGMLVALVVPHAGAMTARHAVRAAARDISLLLSAGRQIAATTASGTAVRFDQAAATVDLTAGSDTLRRIDLAGRYGVRLQTSRDTLAFDTRGLGIGAANLRIIMSRSPAAETLFVSRLGRLRGNRW
jgi:type II secretory pathway pseudopilin PulG